MLPRRVLDVGLAGRRDVLVLAPHPDDEIFGAAALMCALVARRAPGPARRRDRRRGRLRSAPDTGRRPHWSSGEPPSATAALHHLGIGDEIDLVRLGLPDGDVTRHRDELTDRIVAAGAAVIVSTWRHDGHPDHEAVGDAAASAATRTGAVTGSTRSGRPHRGLLDRPNSPEPGKSRCPRRHEQPSSPPPACSTVSSNRVPTDVRSYHESWSTDSRQQRDRVRMTQVPAEDFEAHYRLDDDPWNFGTSAYEQRRFDITIACLPAGRFRRGFEPGCAGGELTVRLSTRCDELVACDGSPTVIQRATRRIAEAADPACHVDARRRPPSRHGGQPAPSTSSC